MSANRNYHHHDVISENNVMSVNGTVDEYVFNKQCNSYMVIV